jgi:hypothetical protein
MLLHDLHAAIDALNWELDSTTHDSDKRKFRLQPSLDNKLSGFKTYSTNLPLRASPTA